jgi:hypothetical protein
MTTPAQRAFDRCPADSKVQRMIYAIEAGHNYTFKEVTDRDLRLMADCSDRQGWATAHRAAVDEIDRRFI